MRCGGTALVNCLNGPGEAVSVVSAGILLDV